jgi:hypothetical protein
MALLWCVRAVDPVAVELARADVGQARVPDELVLLAERDAARFDGVAGLVEETEVDRRRVLAEEREVDALAVPGRAEGIRGAGPDASQASRDGRRGGRGDEPQRTAVALEPGSAPVPP